MREIYLIGMAPPEDKGKAPWPNEHELEPLDLRHGVFPNLVMTPLMSTVMFIDENNRCQFLKSVRNILDMGSSRRLNVFCQPFGKSKEDIPITKEFLTCMHRFNPANELYLVFGYWSSFALLMMILEKPEANSLCKNEITEFSRRFCKINGYVPKNLAAKTGLAFKITREITRGDSAIVEKLGSVFNRDALMKLTSVVPLLHNDAYQNLPVGKSQLIFINAIDGKNIKNKGDFQLYWEYIGEEVAYRLTR